MAALFDSLTDDVGLGLQGARGMARLRALAQGSATCVFGNQLPTTIEMVPASMLRTLASYCELNLVAFFATCHA